MPALLLLCVCLTATASCGPCRNAPSSILAASGGWRTYGDVTTSASGISYDLLARSPAHYAGQTLLIRDAVITDVAQGGYGGLVLSPFDPIVRVEFEGGGLRVPDDCVGRRAVVRGRVTIVVVPEEAMRQRLLAAGRAGAAARWSGGQAECVLRATGVRIAP